MRVSSLAAPPRWEGTEVWKQILMNSLPQAGQGVKLLGSYKLSLEMCFPAETRCCWLRARGVGLGELGGSSRGSRAWAGGGGWS